MIGDMASAIVYVRIIGGLANQMFQYAAGRGLAVERGCPLKLDISGFRTYETWPYRLDIFPLRAQLANEVELSPFETPTAGRVVRRLPSWLRAISPAGNRSRVFREPHFHFTPDLFKQNPPVLLDGHWQSPKYFTAIRRELLETFVPQRALSPYAEEMRRRIASDHGAVSIHVRRGDYVANPAVSKVHPSCSLNYYRRAVELVSSFCPDATFYVFSDDIAFVREAFDFCAPRVLVDGPRAGDYEDLVLMRACSHHIIANSSFGWWGAWLNDAPEKRVIAPKKWFAEDFLRQNHVIDLFPDDWITLG